MSDNHWNRSGRRAGGSRPRLFLVPSVTADELLLFAQRERIRAEFGETGVRTFDTMLQEREEHLGDLDTEEDHHDTTHDD